MKVIKRGLYIITFIISLFIINNKIFAFSDDYILTEEDIYNLVSKQNIDLDLNPNIFCYLSSERMKCYFFDDDVSNNIVITETYSGYLIENSIDTSLTFYSFKSFDSIIAYTDSKIYLVLTGSESVFTNIDKIYNLSDYEKIYKLDIPSDEEKEEELDITIKATNILNFILDKTKNTYEVLINNEIYQLCLGVLLSYLVFMVVYRVIKK